MHFAVSRTFRLKNDTRPFLMPRTTDTQPSQGNLFQRTTKWQHAGSCVLVKALAVVPLSTSNGTFVFIGVCPAWYTAPLPGIWLRHPPPPSGVPSATAHPPGWGQGWCRQPAQLPGWSASYKKGGSGSRSGRPSRIAAFLVTLLQRSFRYASASRLWFTKRHGP